MKKYFHSTFSSLFNLSFFCATCFLSLVSANLLAQQDAQFSQYMFNNLYFNPATAGSDADYTTMGIFHRSQWINYSPTFDDGGAPSSQVGFVSMPLNRINSGIGIHFANDKIGPLSSTEVQISYAYHFNLKNKDRISLGLRGGIYNQRIDFSQYRPNQENDPSIPSTGVENQFQPDLAVGLYYQSAKGYYIGVSTNHLLQSTFDYSTGVNITSLKPHVYLMGGGSFDVSPSLMLQPSAILKFTSGALSYEGSVLLNYNETYFGGISARASNSLDAGILILGVNMLENKDLRITYSLDLVTSGKDAKQPTSHEISIGYRLPSPKPKVVPTIRTPRFRF
ncbi:Bacteroidetes-specific putative membrane protein [Bernardetia litoralis DSM 6794]|uniref:Bacteroidetes-specific putative membrane protein n=1 Tax=Bernardetia litoralis (strain ATCC 23117 / DSM 6794 / NBRC 15988 / NCIMB 1366 / Fx l1 / Sio-4) TaxID=880071 RepID=I4ALX8_BERLS|nr:type IX secretion system membrane protein PorP/SprF [Bernardetia litoralis]AFM04963.1 Bacteroidetes-specific putative membrane protein [Bernardetia litoralis DSM 6794]